MDKKVKKGDLVESFSKYCVKCDGLCCKCAEFTVFGNELEKLPIERKKLTFRKQWKKAKSERCSNVERVSMGDNCLFLIKDKGCVLKMDVRPLDCVSYPVFPIIKYERGEKKMILGMMTHKSCPFAREISKDKKTIALVRKFWEQELGNISKDDLRAWFGDKRNYWLDKNIIKSS